MDTLVAEFLDYLLNTKKYSVHTADAYETDIRDFIQFYETWRGAELLPADLTRIDTIGFRAWLADRGRRDLSHRATARALSSVRSFLRFADKRHGIKNEAIALISSPKIPKKLSKAIETLDVENMTDAAGDVAAEPWIAARDNALVLL
ncbi:MAG: site-specific integrase, partial [Alphaproteobacteria bacterium]|nr:site-specific integrase [Alphaproteobacteria bacterium]